MNFDIIQPKKGKGKFLIDSQEYICEWAALGTANFGPNSPNQKGFLLVRTPENQYAFVGDRPFQKKVNGFNVEASNIGHNKWQWQLSVVKMIILTQDNEQFKCEGEILADRVVGFSEAYIYMNGLIINDSSPDANVALKFKQLHELPPITSLKLNF